MKTIESSEDAGKLRHNDELKHSTRLAIALAFFAVSRSQSLASRSELKHRKPIVLVNEVDLADSQLGFRRLGNMSGKRLAQNEQPSVNELRSD
ncbi:hypothetical protein QA644_18840 [Rhizobium sp. CC1099]|uniref:hypothetical protein n=1 Tax=Rhizobium sp. CC1099 TaxID=3039160 RepID=UPI0024B0D623|nr:hypothetical protein [Rhizobium sp. CC1099]WFU87111.1 hypothetical protein QA644_18840 [Rhizobium sp. CC1099]